MPAAAGAGAAGVATDCDSQSIADSGASARAGSGRAPDSTSADSRPRSSPHSAHRLRHLAPDRAPVAQIGIARQPDNPKSPATPDCLDDPTHACPASCLSCRTACRPMPLAPIRRGRGALRIYMAFPPSSRHSGAKISSARLPVGTRAERVTMARLKKTVVMVGMMGAGKTAVGTALARLLGVPFRDSDEEIVRAANRCIAEIFERDGEPFFRARETEVIAPPAARHALRAVHRRRGFLSEPNRAADPRCRASRSGCAPILTCCGSACGTRRRGPLLRTANPRETLRDALRGARCPSMPRPIWSVDSRRRSVGRGHGRPGCVDALRTRPDVLEEMNDEQRSAVDLGARSYEVRIGAGLIARAGARDRAPAAPPARGGGDRRNRGRRCICRALTGRAGGRGHRRDRAVPCRRARATKGWAQPRRAAPNGCWSRRSNGATWWWPLAAA